MIYLAPVVVPAFSQTNRVHIDVRARKKSNTLALAVDGQLLQVWNDTNGFVGEGTGVRFVHNGARPGQNQQPPPRPVGRRFGAESNQLSPRQPGRRLAHQQHHPGRRH